MGLAKIPLFNTVPPKDFFSFYEVSKNKYREIQPKKVVDFLKFSKNEVATATNESVNQIRYDEKMPIELKERIEEWAAAINLVATFFNNAEKTILWFKIPNPLLGDISPRDMIRLGRSKRLMKFILTALSENQNPE